MSFNIAQLVSVTSETLQARIRTLLPSQQGFGADLQAVNTIVPIIDLTAAAEGSTIPVELQQALSFSDQTTFSANGSTDVIVNTAGFYRIYGISNIRTLTSGRVSNQLSMSDGLSTKVIWDHEQADTPSEVISSIPIDLIVFLRSGDSLSAISSNGNNHINGSSRQIADINGNIVNPTGFTPQ